MTMQSLSFKDVVSIKVDQKLSNYGGTTGVITLTSSSGGGTEVATIEISSSNSSDEPIKVSSKIYGWREARKYFSERNQDEVDSLRERSKQLEADK